MNRYHAIRINIAKILLAHDYVIIPNELKAYKTGRNFSGLIYVKKGQAEYCFNNGEKITVTEGDVFFLSSSSAYYINGSDNFFHYTVNFILGDASTQTFFDNNITVIHPSHPTTYIDLFSSLCLLWREQPLAFQLKASAILYELFYHFISDYLSSTDNNTTNLANVKTYILQHLNENITLKQLATAYNMSVSHFRHLFMKMYGETPISFRNKILISKAKEYIISGYFTIGEVAMHCGFQDANYFSRLFKRHTGVSPTEYKMKYYSQE